MPYPQPLLNNTGQKFRKGKTRVIIDRTLVLETPKHSPPVLALEATRIAEEEFRNRMMANMILLGAIAAHTGWIRLEALEKALAERDPGAEPRNQPEGFEARRRRDLGPEAGQG